MNNRADVQAPAMGWLCRIGERVVVAVAEAQPTLVDLADQAVRQLDFEVGAQRFVVLQMPVDFDITAFAGPLDDMATLLRTRLPAALTGTFLKRLFGLASLFRLATDPIFIALVAALRSELQAGRARIVIDCVEGQQTAIVTMATRGAFGPGDLLVGIADVVRIGKVEHVTPFLARDNDQQKLAAVRFSSQPVDMDFLLVTDSDLLWVDISQRRSASGLATFHAAHWRGEPDMVALLALADSDAGAVLDRFSRREEGASCVHEPFLGFSFELVSSVPLENGLFVSGWFRDPDQLIEAVIAIDPGLEDADVGSAWVTFDGRADIGHGPMQVRRFVAFLTRRTSSRMPLAPPQLRLTLTSGESHCIMVGPSVQDLIGKRQLILDSIAGHAFDQAMLADVYTPALAPLQAAINGRQSVRATHRFGQASTRAISLIIPLYREIGFIRSQLMAFSNDAFVRQHCEIVYVLDDPLIARQVEGILEGSALIYPLDLALVGLAVNGGYALANNFGAAEASGATLVLMNSDVIPEGPDWLEPMVARLQALPAYSLIGPKLIYADETLQHAGMYFYRMRSGNWQNFHYWKGYGADIEAAGMERSVPAVTGACLVVRRSDFLAVGGFTADYVIGDYEDSDLCLKMRQRGGAIHYIGSTRLFHFERQSMPKDEGDTDRGSTMYNRALHTARWAGEIEMIMRNEKDLRHAG